ncbi:p-loop containing nucleoside triphosphate hydrolase [Venustampulla echinocandica]|uniref:p-loop containing nucleoside triphosphate hydrolase n=1 Tax=Venustampulla echinocandica TaxID=2656787 RepID=A0A370TQQ9_9HELO|nr:p-loop containing nucleoside triphosphate hydrolase [Venustampulla echinocandica]RDL37854.1 p-loop containing nucleoside triphosphate hydrolase [Venustampulla echinocandica]
MATPRHIPDSDDSDADIVHTPERSSGEREPSQPQSALSHRFRESLQRPQDGGEAREISSDGSIAVVVPAPARPWEYQPWRGDTTVDTVLEEIETRDGQLHYKVEYEDGREGTVAFDQLLTLENGRNALDLFNNGEDVGTSSSALDSRTGSEKPMATTTSKRIRTRTMNAGFVDPATVDLDTDEEDELYPDHGAVKRRRHGPARFSLLTNNSTRQSSRVSSAHERSMSRAIRDGEGSDSELEPPRTRRGTQPTRGGHSGTRSSTRATRSSNTNPIIKSNDGSFKLAVEDEEMDELSRDSEAASEGSDITHFTQRKSNRRASRNRHLKKVATGRKSQLREFADGSSSSEEFEPPTRRSGRERANKNMKEMDMDEEIYADEVVKTNAPKVISIREIFQPVPTQSRFKIFHNNDCDVCGGTGTHSNKGTSPLIYCQGCSSSIHKVCLGYRSGREHLVTKVGHENFVLQCRRCIGTSVKKDPSAPRLDVCQGCKETGASCIPFSTRKSSKQEEKLREENGGDDPITTVSEDLINNPNNILFRCTRCLRGFHFEHLPTRKKTSKSLEDLDEIRDQRLNDYTPRWQCKDCLDAPDRPQALVAWRPVDRQSYHTNDTIRDFNEDQKEYLIKWQDKSYFQCIWMAGSWVWGVTAVAMRKAFTNRDEGINERPKWTTEEAIPEEFLRMEIVFDVGYDDDFVAKSEESDKAQISMVDEVLVKFQGLGYDEAVWEEPPSPEDKERWSCFVAAYNEYVVGKYFKQPPASVMKERADHFRSLNFKNLELKKQPSALTGGDMMAYQKDGMNWAIYNYHQKKNVILADEMGLGKTIQVIALIAALVKDKPKCWPFLVVTPNSTCPNWRREIKKWAPSLRVVTFYGGRRAREMAMQYELYPDKSSDLRAHVVITSYEAPVDEQSRSFFRRIKWAGLIVDEGQRLKNDANLLYSALKAMKVPFQMLLTGTPLQNNKRELFNLLQFLDASVDAAQLDEEYQELTKENLPELHELIRPFFLRQVVLKDLPPLAQVILPVTMSVVQKKLYKSILAKNPQLIKSIFGQRKTDLRPSERGNLNNILIQLRKCLCHPFLYSSAIEETSVDEAALHRNLIDASAKFQLLEIMLPKLRERGHRVLLFSQFLNQLDLVEDFLKGLDMSFRRLDGSMGAQEKQKRIDEFNAADSSVFAFLLSTRSGGVGINLATADTVIIMDPDFNPQQDIQAISRAHRIGQKNKVLVFQLMTKDSAEEKIIQIGRKKIALGALIESMGAEDDAGVDLESILKHGTEALFNDDNQNDIRYDSASVDKLLDRTQIENTNADEEKTAESQFSLARVWAYDKGTLTDDVGDPDAEAPTPNLSVWDEILKQREADAAREAARNMQDFGRGKRARQTVNYQKSNMDVDDDLAPSSQLARRQSPESPSDEEFAAVGADSDPDDFSENDDVDPGELESSGGRIGAKGTKKSAKSRRTPQKAASTARGQSSSGSKVKTPKKPAILSPPGSGVMNLQGPVQKSRASAANMTPTKSRATGLNGHEEPFISRNTRIIPPTHPPSSNIQIPGPAMGAFQVSSNQHPPTTGPTFGVLAPVSHGHYTNSPYNGSLSQPPPPPLPPSQPPPNSGQFQGSHPRIERPQFRQSYVPPPTLNSGSNGYPNRQPVQHPISREPQSVPRPGDATHTRSGIAATGSSGPQSVSTRLCPICGLSHVGILSTCPKFKSEAQLRLMMDALVRQSTKAPEKMAVAYEILRGELLRLATERKDRRHSRE